MSSMSYCSDGVISQRFRRGDDQEVVHPSERKVLKLLWERPSVARSEVTDFVELSQQSVYRIIDQLAERGIVAIGAPKPGIGRGQASPTVTLKGDFAYTCGISVNTDVIGICLTDFSGRLIAESEVVLRGQGMNEALTSVREKIVGLKNANSLYEENFFGIGFAIAAFYLGGTRYNAPLPLHEWSLIELGPLLANFFEKPVWVNNSSNTAAIAESMFGLGRHIKHFAYLSFNYGFGGGLISNGELLPGGYGNAGSFSAMYDDEEAKHRPALQFLLERLNQNDIAISSIEALRKNFDPNWPGVLSWVDEITPSYNRLINAIRAIFDPHAIVLGGQIPQRLAEMLIARTSIYERHRYGVSRPVPKLITSEINTDASAIGASIVPFRATFY